MSTTTVICEHCGAVCRITDGFCQSCWKKLPLPEVVADDVILDGYGVEEWRRYIGKNADRYVDIYKKHEGKKLFFHINWAAFFLGMNWMLYRKMYKAALFACVIVSLLSVLVSGIVMLPRAEEIKQLRDDRDAYHRHLDAHDTISFADEVVIRGRAAEKELAQMDLQNSLIEIGVVGAFCVVNGLTADALYKAHVKKNILTKDGGTSIGAVFAGRFAISIIMELLTLPLYVAATAIIISFA